MIKRNELFNIIMVFLKVTYECYRQTNYTEDRIAYQSDIAICASWLIELYDEVNINTIIEKILGTSTSKHFFDYYKSGPYGDKQAEAFNNVIVKIKNA